MNFQFLPCRVYRQVYFCTSNLKTKKMKLENNKILITGGASGIGFAMAERFIKENNTVIICGRREKALQEAAEKLPSIITRQCDLTSEHERQQLFTWIAEEHSDVNVLVNNAGIQQWMSISEKTVACFLRVARFWKSSETSAMLGN